MSEEARNDEGLTPTQIIGRCSKCSNHGTIDPVKHKLPARVIDAILAYKIVPSVFCRICMKPTEFIPTEVKKYKDVPFLKTMQDQLVNGVPDIGSASGLVDGNGNPLGK